MAKRRHHYIPQFYLKGFTDPRKENCVWVYDKEEEKLFPSTPLNIAVEKDYHTMINEKSEADTETIENLYGFIESDASKVIQKIHIGEMLDEEDRSIFSLFVSSMLVRVPNYRKNIEKIFADSTLDNLLSLAKNETAFTESYEEFLKKTGTSPDISLDDLRKYTLDGEYDIITNPQVSLAMSISQLLHLPQVFLQMKWAFIRSESERMFLSSDNPLFFWDPTHDPDSFSGVGLMNKNIEVSLPLSNEICAVGGWETPGDYNVIPGKTQLVNNLNRRTAGASLRFVFSSIKSDALLRFVLKYKNSAPTIEIVK